MSLDLRCGDWREALADVGEVDAVIVDAPYSSKTHAGHFAGSVDQTPEQKAVLARKGYDDKRTCRAALTYSSWSTDDVDSFVASWAPRCRGWFVSITDDILAHTWQHAFESVGMYAFPPLPFVEIGKQPRLTGDGPASWSCWVMVARPKSRKFASWGSLPGAYCTTVKASSVAQKNGDRIPGGKPEWLMRAIIGDYTRPGDLVCDPCAGGATTLLAAYQTGRRAIGAELDPATYAKAKARLDQAMAQPHLFDPGLAKAVQNKMF